MTERDKRLRANRKRKGLCPSCGKVASRSSCETCKRKLANWRKDNAAKIRKRLKVSDWARTLVTNARRSSRTRKLGPVEITPEWVEKQFVMQAGRCALTGARMRMSSESWNLFQPSLDRRDPSRGYVVDNVVLVTWGANAARGSATLEAFNEWLECVRGNDVE